MLALILIICLISLTLWAYLAFKLFCIYKQVKTNVNVWYHRYVLKIRPLSEILEEYAVNILHNMYKSPEQLKFEQQYRVGLDLSNFKDKSVTSIIRIPES